MERLAVQLAAENKQNRWRRLKWLDANFEKIFLATGMLSIILLMTFQTAYRYFIIKFTSGAGGAVWTEELARFIFIWISYLAIPVAIKHREMIRVDIIYDHLPKRIQKISWIVVDLCFLALSSIIAYRGCGQISRLMRFPQETAALEISYLIPYLILPFGFAMISFRLFQDLYGQVKECGAKDSLLGLLFVAILALPLFSGLNMPAWIWLFGYFFIFLLIGVPIAIALGLGALMTILGAHTLPTAYLAQLSFTAIDSVPIMAIPFFIAAGTFMGAGGLSKRLLNLADELLGALYGGMALGTIATCTLFAAMSGSGPATVAAIGSLTIPAMVQRGYDKYFSAAVVACAGAIGVMIPPSNPFVVYGIASNASVGKLFMAGIVPGLMTCAMLMFISYCWSKKMDWKGEKRERNIKTFGHAFWDAKWALMVPLIILGGIYGGFFTPTEAAAVAAFYGLVVGVFVYREINRQNFIACLIDSCTTSAIIIVLMAMATIFGNIMTMEQIPNKIATFILGITSNKILILLIINILLLIVGTFMEALAAIVILTPILLPIVIMVGVDPVHFGIILVVNLAIGFITPPVGVNLFVASGVAKVKIEGVAKAALPLLAGMIVLLLLITFIPEISLWLPNLMK